MTSQNCPASRGNTPFASVLYLLCATLCIGYGTSMEALASEVMKFPARSILWVSDANKAERNRSFDAANRFKLKSIQELAVMRFDASKVKGRHINSARLYLKPARPVRVRHIRVSTVTQRWKSRQDLGATSRQRASTWTFADPVARTPWAWPGSVLADVIMSSGNSIATWDETKTAANGWLYVEIPPHIVYAVAAGLSDGLAVADGGTIALDNNYFHGSGTEHRPYLWINSGKKISTPPDPPDFNVDPSPGSGTILLRSQHHRNTFGWRILVNDRSVPQWQIPRPRGGEVTRVSLGKLKPGQTQSVSVQTVSETGEVSAPRQANLVATTEPPAFMLPPATANHATFRSHSSSAEQQQVTAWAPHVKISPLTGLPVAADQQNTQSLFADNGISLSGARGEYISFQLMLARSDSPAPDRFKIDSVGLRGPGNFTIGKPELELFKQWYSRTRAGVWQPAYAVPLAHNEAVVVPDPVRALQGQKSQGIWVDVYIPKKAPAGSYTGEFSVKHGSGRKHTIPIRLNVHDFVLPDKLSYWAELNTYRVPRRDLHQYFQLAHQHRAVFMPWVLRPHVRGSGAELKLDFRNYDRVVGPLLSGTAFAGNRRKNQPVRTMYLPFMDSWPTQLSPGTYNYTGHWPGKGESRSHIVAHYERAPYIGTALSSGYKDAIHAAQQQFVEHFEKRGWNRTEMHVFYGGKNTHRIKYGANMWWTTDEPYHWDDWLAVQFFTRHWMKGPALQSAHARAQWRARSDISRPQWLGRVLDGGTNTIYFAGGNFSDPTRLRQLQQHNGFELRAYGGFSPVGASTTSTITQMLWLWFNGANAFLPWQTLGNDRSLDLHDNVGGAAILIPGRRLGHSTLADFRLKAARDAQQLVEYLKILQHRTGATRAQIFAAIRHSLPSSKVPSGNHNPDDADAMRSATWPMKDFLDIKKAIAKAIAQAQPSKNGTP